MARPWTRFALVLAVASGCASASPSVLPAPSPGSLSQPSTATAAATATQTASQVPTTRATVGATHAPSPTGTATSWETDISSLVPGMDRLHPQLDHGVSLDELNAAASRLAADAPQLNDDQLLDGVMGIVAMVSRNGCDAHTGAYAWGSAGYPLDSIPLRLWLFDTDVRVVDALDPYKNLIGDRVTSIAGVPVGDVITQLDPLIPRDNAQTVRLLLPRYLLIPQVLSGIGIPVNGDVPLTTVDEDGTEKQQVVHAVPMSDYNDWAGPYGLLLPADDDVLYLSRTDEELWWQDLGDGTLFVQYNQVAFVSHLVGELRDAIKAPGIARVVLDLRHNTGGEVRALDALADLFSEPGVIAPGQFFVITSRNTFSAAGLLVARLQQDAHAMIVGEAMGACPTAWGNSREFTLPFSKLPVSVATLLEVGVSADDDRPTIEPDIVAPLSFPDWSAHSDPALAAIETLP